MKSNSRLSRGFTLVELMIVVAIIGILAAMAIPNYLAFTTKAKQSEAKSNLGGIFTAEVSYFTEHGRYTDIFTAIPWSTMPTAKYTYDLGGGSTEGHPVGTWTWSVTDAFPGVSADGNEFSCAAYGNLDTDNTIDQWLINTSKDLQVRMDDSRAQPSD